MTNFTVTFTIAVAVLAIAVAVIVMLVTRVIDTRSSPGSTVEQYLRSIAAGDATAANELFDPQSIAREYLPTGLSDTTSFMSDAALGGASERITDIEIVRVSSATRANVASVFYRYLLAREHVEGALALQWMNGEWRLVTGLWQILQVRPVFDRHAHIEIGQITVTLGGAEASWSEASNQTGSLIAYPGVYQVAVEARGWVADATVTIPRVVQLVTPNDSVVLRPRFVASQEPG